jgi:phosphoglycerate dehydrogenase-like enzyme
VSNKSLVVTFEVKASDRATIADALGGAADAVYLAGAETSARADMLRHADALLVRNPPTELQPHELQLIGRAQLVQFMTAGVDFIPLHDFPAALPLASNGGAYAEPMAEHALAMVLAAAKRLLVEHRNLSQGEFNQFAPNKMLAGGICGVLGFGGVGKAVARLLRGLGMHIHAINRRAAADEPVERIGGPGRLDELLSLSDVLVISVPLTRLTERLIGARELALMKDDAILVNVARGEIVEEAALYEHLRTHPQFTACIDAWWIEPIRHGSFRMDYPFMRLPNVIGSPHNSASVAATPQIALRRAVANCRRARSGEAPHHLIGPEQ